MVIMAMAIQRERDRGCTEYPGCWYWWQEEGEPDFFPFGKEAEGFPVHRGFRDRATVIRAKARPRLLASLSRSHVTITINLDI